MSENHRQFTRHLLCLQLPGHLRQLVPREIGMLTPFDRTEYVRQCLPIVRAGAGMAQLCQQQLSGQQQKRVGEFLIQILSQPVHRVAVRESGPVKHHSQRG